MIVLSYVEYDFFFGLKIGYLVDCLGKGVSKKEEDKSGIRVL